MFLGMALSLSKFPCIPNLIILISWYILPLISLLAGSAGRPTTHSFIYSVIHSFVSYMNVILTSLHCHSVLSVKASLMWPGSVISDGKQFLRSQTLPWARWLQPPMWSPLGVASIVFASGESSTGRDGQRGPWLPTRAAANRQDDHQEWAHIQQVNHVPFKNSVSEVRSSTI